MQVSITGRHVEITDAIREYVYDRVKSELGGFPRIISVHAVLNVEKYRQQAEVVVRAAHHVHAEGHAESEDLYVSIDEAIEKVARQLRKLRDRMTDHKGEEKLGVNEVKAESRTESAE